MYNQNIINDITSLYIVDKVSIYWTEFKNVINDKKTVEICKQNYNEQL